MKAPPLLLMGLIVTVGVVVNPSKLATEGLKLMLRVGKYSKFNGTGGGSNMLLTLIFIGEVKKDVKSEVATPCGRRAVHPKYDGNSVQGINPH